jgi:hypothetical protein
MLRRPSQSRAATKGRGNPGPDRRATSHGIASTSRSSASMARAGSIGCPAIRHHQTMTARLVCAGSRIHRTGQRRSRTPLPGRVAPHRADSGAPSAGWRWGPVCDGFELAFVGSRPCAPSVPR